MTDDPSGQLWTRRSTGETQAFYAGWAETYDADIAAWGYATPGRIAMALRRAGANVAKPLLDFGCGTGLSGMALRAAGFQVVDGTDISPEMLARAEARGVYRQVWLGQPGALGPVTRGAYPFIAAAGVISVGAAPPETLDLLLSVLPPAGLLAFSFNDRTMADRAYTDRLDIACLAPDIEVALEEDGPHLPALGMNATVFVLRRT